MSGKENIEYFGGLYRLSNKEIFNNVNYWIDEFELRDAMDKKVAYYSRAMV